MLNMLIFGLHEPPQAKTLMSTNNLQKVTLQIG